MLQYYKNKKVSILFDKMPKVCIRYYLPNMTNQERVSIERYPFINKRNLVVMLIDLKRNKTYEFQIPKSYCYDGASIPRVFWNVVGSNTDNKFLIPALIHDVLCEHHEFINNDRKFSTEVFNALLEASKVNCCKRFFMKHSVNFYQIFCKWEKKSKKKVTKKEIIQKNYIR